MGRRRVARPSAVGLLERYSTKVGVKATSVKRILRGAAGRGLGGLLRVYGRKRRGLGRRVRGGLRRYRSAKGSPGPVTRKVS